MGVFGRFGAFLRVETYKYITDCVKTLLLAQKAPYFQFFAFVVSYTRARYPYIGFCRFLARFCPIFRFKRFFSALNLVFSVWVYFRIVGFEKSRYFAPSNNESKSKTKTLQK